MYTNFLSVVHEYANYGASMAIRSLENYQMSGQNFINSCINTRQDNRQSSRNKASKRQKLVVQCFLLTSAKTQKFQDGDRSTRVYMAVSLQQDEFRTNPLNVGIMDIQRLQPCVNKLVSSGICKDYVVTHRQTDTHTNQLL